MLAALCSVVWMALILTSCSSNEEVKVKLYSKQDPTYQNPFTLPEEWEDYGIGDPYILRHDGMYYLYCSTKDGRPGIKGWSSEDLIHWIPEGLVTEDPITTGAYAPEVVYWNGYFYMYTSPAGNGHYVLRSERPTGPFEVQTENLGLSIDGSVFIDDNSQWYFTHAGDLGIVIHPMTDPYTMDFGTTTNAFLGHWTEGSTIIKRNGTYYMTYTGNHVFSKGYRINYAVAHDDPTGTYQVPENNPLVIHTSGSFVGLGHSSSFMGPDLDSYYMVYHNLVGRSAEGPPVRQMDIDRLVFNGDRMEVLGPTNTAQPVPKQADFHSRLDQPEAEANWDMETTADGTSRWVSKAETTAGFTAEYNLSLKQPTDEEQVYVEAIFSYTDSENYWSARLKPANGELSVMQVREGQVHQLDSLQLPEEFDYTKLHTVRVENDGSAVRVYFDQMQKFNLPVQASVTGRIGYAAFQVDPSYSYTAFSNDVNGSSDFEVYKPIPGTVDAVHYLKEPGRGFQVNSADSAAEVECRKAEGVSIGMAEDRSYFVKLEQEQDWLSYKINVAKGGTYGLSIRLLTTEEAATIEVSSGKQKQTFKLAADAEPGWKTIQLGTMELPEGYHTLKIKLLKGQVAFRELNLYASAKVPKAGENLLDAVEAEEIYGAFEAIDGGFQGSGIADDRLFVGDADWDDYELSLKVGIPESLSGEGQVFVRTTNESYFQHQVQDSAMGYAISLTDGQLQLLKLNYDSLAVSSGHAEMEPGQTYTLRVVMNGSRIQVYWGEADEPVIDFTDSDPFFHGRVGLRSIGSTFRFSEMQVNETR
ncbi:MAG: family 43 glycosylhydrolase [Paenibacillus sp.]|uniref:family 43 glycosylhydrolase n=1 Tax=Paenibacillus sp. TaxID=58172 RepID=UPI00290DEA8B|nr:family 43 glycosylhydrolase [Paenibacillus sp.]MDU4694221.1 family 43 glycosylhydrolase [Paenibacillus sp.]